MPVIVTGTRYDYNKIGSYRKATGDLPYPAGTLLQAEDGNTCHVVDAYNKLRWIPDSATFESLGFDWNKIIRVPRSVMDLYASPEEITSPNVAWTKWGTKITDADPLILTSPDAPKKRNYTMIVVVVLVVLGVLYWKFGKK